MVTQNTNSFNTEGLVAENLKGFVLKAIAYVLDPLDEEEFLTLFPHKFDRIRENALNTDKYFEQLSSNQRVLLATYIHLYLLLREIDINSDPRCKNIRNQFGLINNYVELIKQAMAYFPKFEPLGEVTPLALVINPTPEIVNWASTVVYLTVKNEPYLEKVQIKNLKSQEYEHDQDRMMLEALRKTKGFDTVVKKFYEYGIEPFLRVQYTGSNIKVNPSNFPHLHRALTKACLILGVSPIPDLYLQQGFINAATIGVEKPLIVLDSGCVNLLSYDELLFIIGHELGHIKSNHLLYHNISLVLPILGELIGSVTLGIGGIIATGISVALLNWQRMSEYTADRAGLLCCQNMNAVSKVMMKVAGAPPKYYSQLNPEHFIQQAKEFSDYDVLTRNKVAKLLSIMGADHPWTIMRGGQLLKWVDSGAYSTLLKRGTFSDN